LIDFKDFIVKKYQSIDKLRIQKWYMLYCADCGKKRNYLPKTRAGKCLSCASKGRIISEAQRASISKTLMGNKNAANITPEKIIERTSRAMNLSVEEYLSQRDLSKAIRKIKKNMSDRLIRFVKNQRRSIKYFPFTQGELISHLEKRFYPHPETNELMTWLNYGRIAGVECWEIDHRIPLRYKEDGRFYWDQNDLQDPTSVVFQKAWSLDNLQPKWARFNWQKGAKYRD
jgi:hypothetical protein